MAMRPPPLHLGQVFDLARTNLQVDKLYTFFVLIVNSLALLVKNNDLLTFDSR